MYRALFLVEFLHNNFGAVRNLFVVIEEQFLADNFRDEESCWFVGQGILSEERSRDGQ